MAAANTGYLATSVQKLANREPTATRAMSVLEMEMDIDMAENDWTEDFFSSFTLSL